MPMPLRAYTEINGFGSMIGQLDNRSNSYQYVVLKQVTDT
jgi:hypothetical protein